MPWICYILRCADDTLYCGVTNNLQRRIDRHNAGNGAKYTRSRLPVELAWSRDVGTVGNALRLEHRIKMLTRDEKLRLVGG